jgi:hypothetical protein
MNKELISERKISSLGFLIGQSFFSGALSAFLLHDGLAKSPPDLVAAGIGLFFAAVTLLFLYGCLTMISYRMYADRIETYSVSGKLLSTALISDIQAWSTENKKDNKKNREILTLYTDSAPIVFWSDIPNYDQVKNIFTAGKPNEKRAVPDWLDIHAGSVAYLMMGVGIVMLYVSFLLFQYCRKPILPADLKTITYSITQRPKWSGGKTSEIMLKLDQYPDFGFSVPEEALLDSPWLFMDSVRKFDTISIGIIHDEYEKKLAKTKPIGIIDMGMNFKFIDVFSLKFRGRDFVSLRKYNSVFFKGNLIVIPLLLSALGLLCLLQGYLYMKKAKRARL